MPPSSKVKFSFPIIDETEILDVLQELAVDFKRSDLIKPTAEKVQNLWKTFYENLTGEDVYDLEAPAPFADEVLKHSYPSTHIQSIPTYTFFYLMRDLFKNCDVSDFRLSDITSGITRRRLIIQLSALFNFVRFREDHLEFYRKLALSTEPVVADLRTARNRHQELDTRLQALRTREKEAQPVLQDLNKKTDAAQLEFATLNRTLGTLRNTEEAAASAVAVARTREESLARQAEELQADVQRLTNEIVEDPESVTADIDRLQVEIERVQEESGGLEREIRRSRVRFDDVRSALQTVEDALELLRRVQQASTRGREADGQAREADREVTSLTAQTTDNERRSAQWVHERETLVSRLERQSTTHRERMKEISDQLSGLRGEKDNISSELVNLEAQLAQSQRKTSALRTSIQNDAEQYAHRKAELQTRLETLISSFVAHSKELSRLLS